MDIQESGTGYRRPIPNGRQTWYTKVVRKFVFGSCGTRGRTVCASRRVLGRKSTNMHIGAGIVILEAGASCERLGRKYSVAYLQLESVPQMA
jgi:hypothetical protein